MPFNNLADAQAFVQLPRGPVHNPSGGNSRNRVDCGMQRANIETFDPLAARKPCDLTLVCQTRRGLNVPQREVGNRSVALHD